MKTYSDLPDTKLKLDVELELVGRPEFTLKVGSHTEHNQTYYLDPLTPFTVIIELMNKNYNSDNETAVIIRRLCIDNISIIPEYTQYAEYNNDHGFTDPTNYLGFNGKWTLTIDRPFYQWLHQARSQGWLIG
jgi:hypothetical protein